MELDDLGDVIAEREMEVDDGRTVLFRIGKPQPYPDGHDFYCPFEVSGLTHEHTDILKKKVMHAGGVDSVQALILAIQAVGAILYTSNEARAGKLTWLGTRNLGIPVDAAINDIVRADDE